MSSIAQWIYEDSLWNYLVGVVVGSSFEDMQVLLVEDSLNCDLVVVTLALMKFQQKFGVSCCCYTSDPSSEIWQHGLRESACLWRGESSGNLRGALLWRTLSIEWYSLL